MTGEEKEAKKRQRRLEKEQKKEQRKQRLEEKRRKTKNELRSKYKKLRDEIPAEKRSKASGRITKRLLKLTEVENALIVYVYAAYGSEVSTKEFINTLLKEGRRVALPKVTGEEMAFYEIKSADELFPGFQGILEPQVWNNEPVRPSSRDVVIMPGVVFDYAGHRIGYGKGYYDRYLGNIPGKPVLIGAAYEKQVYRYMLPSEETDKILDYVVTEKKKVKTKEDKEKGFGILDFVIEFVLELLLELLDGVG